MFVSFPISTVVVWFSYLNTASTEGIRWSEGGTTRRTSRGSGRITGQNRFREDMERYSLLRIVPAEEVLPKPRRTGATEAGIWDKGRHTVERKWGGRGPRLFLQAPRLNVFHIWIQRLRKEHDEARVQPDRLRGDREELQVRMVIKSYGKVFTSKNDACRRGSPNVRVSRGTRSRNT